MKTKMDTTIKREYVKFDAAGKSVGRLATQIALTLRGKHKPSYTPHIDNGDFVVVNHVDQLTFTGKKFEQKKYYSYSGYPGGLKEKGLKKLFQDNPGDVLKRAVYQMLPDNKLRDVMIKRLVIKK